LILVRSFGPLDSAGWCAGLFLCLLLSLFLSLSLIILRPDDGGDDGSADGEAEEDDEDEILLMEKIWNDAELQRDEHSCLKLT